jgi:hypothetical protein
MSAMAAVIVLIVVFVVLAWGATRDPTGPTVFNDEGCLGPTGCLIGVGVVIVLAILGAGAR